MTNTEDRERRFNRDKVRPWERKSEQDVRKNTTNYNSRKPSSNKRWFENAEEVHSISENTGAEERTYRRNMEYLSTNPEVLTLNRNYQYEIMRYFTYSMCWFSHLLWKDIERRANLVALMSLASRSQFLNTIFLLKKLGLFEEMANSRSGAGVVQDKPRISCHTR